MKRSFRVCSRYAAPASPPRFELLSMEDWENEAINEASLLIRDRFSLSLAEGVKERMGLYSLIAREILPHIFDTLNERRLDD